ncbi:energy transducer TonB [Pedobacter panaciterrae]|uniref:energy transducer TonB n=1 Tax=Pedobacter panaciterrae TaxID=363849 RepID=UPI00155DB0B6|nr:energy transducer TonB [Pedobacter panaciterrae]NQX54461.1 energy transducer TonB [Pedobacter panaciterrae]
MLNLKTLGLLILSSLLFSVSWAQETKTISFKRKNDYFTIAEKYSVLKSNPEIKQGPYSASLSSYSEKGQFEADKKAGIWESYYNGKLVQKYDFATQSFLQDDVFKMISSVEELDEQGNSVKDLGSRGVYFGGDSKMIAILVRSIRYPASAQENNIQGWVVLEAKIDKQGKLTQEKAISTNGYGLEEEGLRVFKMLPPDWVPVIVDGKPVDAKFQLKIAFRLSHLPDLKN